MKKNRYFENYLSNLQKDVFLIAFDNNYDIVEFIICYMRSDVKEQLDKKFSSWQSQSSYRIFEEVISMNDVATVDKQTINRDAVEWLGYFYSRWHFLTGETSREILKFLHPKEGLKDYFVLHQLDESEAIDMCKRKYNLSRNNHRLNEYKNSKESKVKYSNPVYYSFLAVRMLYKLSRSKIYETMEYIGDKKEYDFANNDYDIGIKTEVIFSNDETSVIEKYNRSDILAFNFSRKANKTIYFCFVFSSRYELDDNNDEKLLQDIRKITNEYAPNKRRFDYLYFFMLGKIYEVTSTNELFIYSLPLSQRERSGIENKMKKYGLM